MNKDLKFYLLSLNISENQIKTILKLCPALKNITYQDAINNIMMVVQKGYPIEDIDMLICANPHFLVADPSDLNQDLNKLGYNVEELLKEDPFLI